MQGYFGTLVLSRISILPFTVESQTDWGVRLTLRIPAEHSFMPKSLLCITYHLVSQASLISRLTRQTKYYLDQTDGRKELTNCKYKTNAISYLIWPFA